KKSFVVALLRPVVVLLRRQPVGGRLVPFVFVGPYTSLRGLPRSSSEADSSLLRVLERFPKAVFVCLCLFLFFAFARKEVFLCRATSMLCRPSASARSFRGPSSAASSSRVTPARQTWSSPSFRPSSSISPSQMQTRGLNVSCLAALISLLILRVAPDSL